MSRIQRSASVQRPIQAVFDLINDIEAYPQFLDGIVHAEVLEASEYEILGRLVVRKAGIERQLITLNRIHRPNRISLHLKEGPLKQLAGHWLLKELSENSCQVSLDLTFEAQGRLAGLLFAPVFKQIADSMVGAFVQRAQQVIDIQ